MAEIDVVASYERWGAANETNFKNNHHQAQTIDIRRLDLAELPDDIDIIVGSPPCTQFSYSNRGGAGDIADGLKDIIKFLTIVDHIKPKAWVMENVPRVATILQKELRPKGRLAKFAHLGMAFHVINMEEFGLPQRRKRCIAGDFDYDLLKSYVDHLQRITLGDVVAKLGGRSITDPIYGTRILKAAFHDHVIEDFLNEEEVRINRANKLMHPVYNAMPFPDPLNRAVRTVTATCTRVSRESIVIDDPKNVGSFRRLTIREKASLQGFPVAFQFYGVSYGQKQRMVGNAVPPLISFYVGQALRGVSATDLKKPHEGIAKFRPPTTKPKSSAPDCAGAHYRLDRTFRFAIPSLRLKSGVRFELRNILKANTVLWEVTFIFGTPKYIHRFPLGPELVDTLLDGMPRNVAARIRRVLIELALMIRSGDITHMQTLWCHKGPGGTRAFDLLDRLSEHGEKLIPLVAASMESAREVVAAAVRAEFAPKKRKLVGLTKLDKNAALILAGMFVGSTVNAEFHRHASRLPSEQIDRKKREQVGRC